MENGRAVCQLVLCHTVPCASADVRTLDGERPGRCWNRNRHDSRSALLARRRRRRLRATVLVRLGVSEAVIVRAGVVTVRHRVAVSAGRRAAAPVQARVVGAAVGPVAQAVAIAVEHTVIGGIGNAHHGPERGRAWCGGQPRAR